MAGSGGVTVARQIKNGQKVYQNAQDMINGHDTLYGCCMLVNGS